MSPGCPARSPAIPTHPPFFKQGTFQPQTPTCVELHLALNDLSCSASNNHHIQFLFKHIPNGPIGRTARPTQLELVWGAYLVRQNCVLRPGTFREQLLIYQYILSPPPIQTQHHHHHYEEKERQLAMYKGPSGKLMEMRKNGIKDLKNWKKRAASPRLRPEQSCLSIIKEK